MEPSFGEVMMAIVLMGIPMLTFGILMTRWMRLKEKRIEVDAMLAAEKAAQYVSHNREVEQRLQVLEQIVTDRGLETASQIEALRKPRLTA